MNSRIADQVRHATIEEWLGHYQADSSVFASPTVSLMAHGTALERHTSNAQGQLLSDAQALLAQAAQQGLDAPC